jgi:hypothetical protein
MTLSRTEKFIFILFYLLLVFSDSRLYLYCIFALILFFNLKFVLAEFRRSKFFILLIFCTSLYGIILGLLRSNGFSYIFSNAASTLFLLLLPIVKFYSNILLSVRFLKVVMFTLFVQFVIVLFMSFGLSIDVYNSKSETFTAFLGYFSGGGSIGGVRFYSIKAILGFSFSILLAINYINKSKYLAIIYISFSLFFVLVMLSKGLVVGAFLIYIGLLWKSLKSFSGVFILLFFGFTLYYIQTQIDIFGVAKAAYDSEDVSNVTRFEQIDTLLSEGFPFGKGYGASISSLVRDEDSPYGFEISFLSYWHKIGVFFFFYMFILVYLFLNNLYIFLTRNGLNSLVVLSSLIYVIPALGNPTLFHISSVYLFFIAFVSNKNLVING